MNDINKLRVAGFFSSGNNSLTNQGGMQGYPGFSSQPTNTSPSSGKGKGILSIIEKLGGIEGIMSNIDKVQQVTQRIQQMAPMFQLLGSMFKKKSSRQRLPRRKRTRPRRRSVKRK